MEMDRSISQVAENKSNKETSIPNASQGSAPSEKTEAPSKSAER